jgi:ribosomal protein L24
MSNTPLKVNDRVLITRQVAGAKKGAEGTVTALYGERACIAEVRITNHNMPGCAGLLTIHTAVANLHKLTSPKQKD